MAQPIKTGSRNKDAKRELVLKATLSLVTSKGIAGVSISKVALKSGVSRAWIYKYIGKNHQYLLQFAMEEFAKQLVPAQAYQGTAISQVKKRLRAGLDILWEADPQILGIYLKHLNSNSELGTFIRSVESKYIENLAQTLQNSGLLMHKDTLAATSLFVHMRMSLIHYAKSRSLSKQHTLQLFNAVSGLFRN